MMRRLLGGGLRTVARLIAISTPLLLAGCETVPEGSSPLLLAASKDMEAKAAARNAPRTLGMKPLREKASGAPDRSIRGSAEPQSGQTALDLCLFVADAAGAHVSGNLASFVSQGIYKRHTLRRVQSLQESQGCDVMFRIDFESGIWGASLRASVFSAYSQGRLYDVETVGGLSSQRFAVLVEDLEVRLNDNPAMRQRLQADKRRHRKREAMASKGVDPMDCPEPEEDETPFEDTVKRFHSGAIKRQVPEEAHKFDVQAQFAVEKKSFEDAAARYSDALRVALWWPQAHYNRAIILAKISCYEEAIREMKRYLLLTPNAPDARKAQDKIYAWESASQ